jgi:D-alanine-D-alanine ligase
MARSPLLPARKRRRVLVLLHRDLVPPRGRSQRRGPAIVPWRTEHDILRALDELGHEVRLAPVHDDLGVLQRALREFDPHVTFNLLEEFLDVATYAPAVIAFLELSRRATTGCNPRGLFLAHDKLLTKQILAWHGVRTPRCTTFAAGAPMRVPRELGRPLIVKSAVEDASLGIARASVVTTPAQLARRVRYLHERFGTDAIAEEYVEGRELYVAMLGNGAPEVLPIWELTFGDWPDGAPRIATERVKWSRVHQKRHRIRSARARGLSPRIESEIASTCRRVYSALSLSGYARIDLRLDSEGRAWVLEANANPDLACDEDFARAALAAGWSYPRLVQRIVELGLAWRAPWR